MQTPYNHSFQQICMVVEPIQSNATPTTYPPPNHWLYQRNKHRIPQNDPLKNPHHVLPKEILDNIVTSFTIKHIHSYFSPPITCSTHLTKIISPFPRDKFLDLFVMNSHIDGRE